MIYAFERRSATLWAINSGYQVVALAAMGAILGGMDGLKPARGAPRLLCLKKLRRRSITAHLTASWRVVRVILRCAAVLSIAALGSCPAIAGRPLQTDDAGVLGRGSCEIESAALQRRADAARDHESSAQFSCGLGWKQQLGITGAATATENDRQTGLSIDGKGGLWSAGDDGPAISMGWQLSEARTPGGSWHHVGTGLNLILSAPLSAVDTVHANIGHARDDRARTDSSTWGVGIEHAPPGVAWVPTAEVFGDDRQRPWANVGVRLEALPDRLFLAVSWGRQLRPADVNLVTASIRLGL